MKYDAILFDFDGVLVDSEPLHHACWNEILNRFGLTLGWDEYARNCIGVSDRAMVQSLCDIFGKPGLFDPVWALYPEKKALFRRRIADEVPMPEATRSLIGELAEYRLAVVSSSGRAEVEPPLDAAGIRAAFSTIVCGEDVARLKPAPDPYLEAAKRLGIRRALVVEDSDAGVESGRAAGFDVVRIDHAERTAVQVRAALAR